MINTLEDILTDLESNAKLMLEQIQALYDLLLDLQSKGTEIKVPNFSKVCKDLQNFTSRTYHIFVYLNNLEDKIKKGAVSDGGN